jgi:two-component system vancomycin resistance associated response regulator VraR
MNKGVRYTFWGLPFLIVGAVFCWYAGNYPSHSWKTAKEQKIEGGGTFFFSDLENDGELEKVYLSNPLLGKGEPSVYIYSEDDRFLDLWTLDEALLIGHTYLVEDFNEDNKEEFYCFTHKNDSLFMYGMDPQYGERFFIKRRFFLSPSAHGLGLSLNIQSLGAFDATHDGFNELIFGITDPDREVTYIAQYDYINNTFQLSEPIMGKLIHANKAAPGDEPFFYLSVNYSGRDKVLKSVVGVREDLSLITTSLGRQVTKTWYFNHPGDYGSLYIAQLPDSDRYVVGTLHNNETEEVLQVSGEVQNAFISGSKLFVFTRNKITTYDAQSFEKSNEYKQVLVEEVAMLAPEAMPYFLIQYEQRLSLLSQDLELLLREKNISEKVQQAYIIPTQNSELPILAIHFNNRLVYVSLEPVPWVKYRWLWTFVIIFGGFGLFILLRYLVILIMQHKKLKSTLGGEYSKVLNTRDQYKLVKRMPLTHFVNEENSRGGDIQDEESAFTAPFISYFNELMNELSTGSLELNYHLFPQDPWLDVREESARDILEAIRLCTKSFHERFYAGRTNLQLLRDSGNIQLYIDFEPLEVELGPSNEKFRNGLVDKLQGFSHEIMVDITMEGHVIVAIAFALPKPEVPEMDSTRKLRVLLAEDHDVTLYGLMSLFKSNNDMEVVATAKDGYEVLSKIHETKPDVVVTDIAMPEMDGIELTARLRKEHPGIHIVVFTMYMENWFVDRLLQNGVRAMVSKSSSIHELVHAIQASVSKSSYFCPRFREKFGLEIQFTDEGVKRITRQLSVTEFHILHLLKKDGSKMNLAGEIGIQLETLDMLLANLMLKLNAGDMNELERIARHLDICLPENLN